MTNLAETPLKNPENLSKRLGPPLRFRFDMKARGERPHEGLSGVRTAAVAHLHQIMDRVRDQQSRTKDSPKI
jgi:hypothetical protein